MKRLFEFVVMDQRGKGKANNKAPSKGSSSSSSMKGKKPEFAATLEQFISQMLPLVDLEKVLCSLTLLGWNAFRFFVFAFRSCILN